MASQMIPKLASKEKRAKRMLICLGCPSSRRSYGAGLTCGKFMAGDMKADPPTCGCKLSWKTSLEEQKCPQGKW